MSAFIDMTGQRFHRLKVVRYVGYGAGQAKWECLCDCGRTKICLRGNLIQGRSESCGCLRTESLNKRTTTHGAAAGGKTSEYNTWSEMKQRTTVKTSQRYADYGGRGIKMCERWLNSFENFLNDMGAKPSKIHSIERVNNDGGYTPENCCWATPTVQNRNTRRTRWVTYGGETKSAAEWAEIKGINIGTFYTRLNNPHNTLEEIMETPTGMTRR